MSSGVPNFWAPPKRWRKPNKDILLNRVYESDYPGFDPFPTVTQVVKAAYCRVAVIHDLFHGLSSSIADEEAEAMPRQKRRSGWGLGKFYHEFTARVKHEVGLGRIPPTQDRILSMLWRECVNRGFRYEDALIYVQPWIQSRLYEGDLSAGNNTFFEVQVASHVKFKAQGDSLDAYIMGKIDEIDFDEKYILERTTQEHDGQPPPLKEFQVWLLWKILTFIDKNKIPEPWRKNYSEFRLFVETPHTKKEVDKHRVDFESMAIRALGWIKDVCNEYTMRSSIRRAYQEDFNTCKSQNRMMFCNISLCYAKQRLFPRSRPIIRAQFRDMYPSLLWATMWERDKLRYQLLLLSLDELKELGILCEGKVESSTEGEIELSFSPEDLEVIRRKVPEELSCKLLVGTPSMGIETDAWIDPPEIKENRCTLKYDWKRMPSTQRASLLFSGVSIFKASPTFLQKIRQRSLFSLERWGKDKEAEARKDPIIRLLEACFGRDRLDMGGP